MSGELEIWGMKVWRSREIQRSGDVWTVEMSGDISQDISRHLIGNPLIFIGNPSILFGNPLICLGNPLILTSGDLCLEMS
jgi:hypothetical protein